MEKENRNSLCVDGSKVMKKGEVELNYKFFSKAEIL